MASRGLSRGLAAHSAGQRNEDERLVLQGLAAGTGGDVGGAAARDLEREGYLCRRHGELAITVPIFADWIAETASAARVSKSA